MAENEIRVTFSEEEMAYVKEQGRGFIRKMVQSCMAGGEVTGTGSVEWTVLLTPEESNYVKVREMTSGTGWFSRVAQINMEAAANGRPPFYWLQPEGLEET